MREALNHFYIGFFGFDVSRYRKLLEDEFNVIIKFTRGERPDTLRVNRRAILCSAFRPVGRDGMVLIAQSSCLFVRPELPPTSGQIYDLLEQIDELLCEMENDGTFPRRR